MTTPRKLTVDLEISNGPYGQSTLQDTAALVEWIDACLNCNGHLNNLVVQAQLAAPASREAQTIAGAEHKGSPSAAPAMVWPNVVGPDQVAINAWKLRMVYHDDNGDPEALREPEPQELAAAALAGKPDLGAIDVDQLVQELRRRGLVTVTVGATPYEDLFISQQPGLADLDAPALDKALKGIWRKLTEDLDDEIRAFVGGRIEGLWSRRGDEILQELEIDLEGDDDGASEEPAPGAQPR